MVDPRSDSFRFYKSDNMRKGDVLVVWKLDPLGRDLAHLVNTVQVPGSGQVSIRA